jgi:hypothetical protein
MKFWTILAGLAVAGMLTSSAFAQGGKGGKKGGTRGMAVTFDEAKGDGTVVNQKSYVEAVVKKMKAARADMTEDQITQAKTRIETRWAALAKAGKIEVTGEFKNAADYDAAVKALPARTGKRGGGGTPPANN